MPEPNSLSSRRRLARGAWHLDRVLSTNAIANTRHDKLIVTALEQEDAGHS
jgi:hypothetical protein